jgi:hypothetical protein
MYLAVRDCLVFTAMRLVTCPHSVFTAVKLATLPTRRGHLRTSEAPQENSRCHTERLSKVSKPENSFASAAS